MTTLPSDTRAITIDTDRDIVYAFCSNPENLPRWAIHFCKEIRQEDRGWRVTTPESPRGEVRLEMKSDPATGVVDYLIEPEPGVRQVAHSRIVANGDGTEVLFTQYRYPGMSEEQFDRQIGWLMEELHTLAGRMEAGRMEAEREGSKTA